MPTMGKKQITIDITDTVSFSGEPVKEVPQRISMKVEIDHNGVTLDAFDVAKKACFKPGRASSRPKPSVMRGRLGRHSSI